MKSWSKSPKSNWHITPVMQFSKSWNRFSTVPWTKIVEVYLQVSPEYFQFYFSWSDAYFYSCCCINICRLRKWCGTLYTIDRNDYHVLLYFVRKDVCKYDSLVKNFLCAISSLQWYTNNRKGFQIEVLHLHVKVHKMHTDLASYTRHIALS